jgi:hypothetical protein
MDDGEIAVVTADSIDVFNDMLEPVEKERHTVRLGRVGRRKGRI